MQHAAANRLLIGILLGVVLGGLCGWFWGPEMLAIAWIGEFFLRALKMLIVPLVFAAVVSGIASMGDVRKLGKLGGMTLLYFLATTGIAVLVGIVLVNVIQPGSHLQELASQAIAPEKVADKQEIHYYDIILSLVSDNIFAAAATNQILPILVFAILFGSALTIVPAGKPVIAFFNGLDEALLKVVTWIVYLAPVGIFAMVASRLGKAGGGPAFAAELQSVGLYVLTVLIALTIHFVILLFIMTGLAKRGLDLLKDTSRALLTAFGTASSSATLPLTIETSRESGIDERALNFTIPLGSTVNMNGTALYEAVAALFIAQAYGIDLGVGEQVIIFLTATLAAIGAAGIPEAGLVTMVIVLQAVGLPLEGVGILLTVDWFLDRFRTTINVWGDIVGAAVVSRFLPPQEPPKSANPQ